MNKKILIVDDEPEILELLTLRLKANSYDVIRACDGREALEKYLSEKPDLIVLDVMMPNMDGYSFVIELKKIEDGLKTPVVILTGKDQMEDLFKMEGVVDYVKKPYDAVRLLGIIEKNLKKRAGLVIERQG